jgi:hypothetical protein
MRNRECSVELTIELFNQADLMKKKEEIFNQTRREEVSTQRTSSQFEMTENFVSSRKQASIRDRVVTRERERERDRNRDRDRECSRERKRENKSDISTSTEEVSEIIQ